jgi:hypothetical protein
MVIDSTSTGNTTIQLVEDFKDGAYHYSVEFRDHANRCACVIQVSDQSKGNDILEAFVSEDITGVTISGEVY